jgi:hypothetical protein
MFFASLARPGHSFPRLASVATLRGAQTQAGAGSGRSQEDRKAKLACHTLNVRRLRAERRLLLFLGHTGVRRVEQAAAGGGATEARSPSPAPNDTGVRATRGAAGATSRTTTPRSAPTDPPRSLDLPGQPPLSNRATPAPPHRSFRHPQATTRRRRLSIVGCAAADADARVGKSAFENRGGSRNPALPSLFVAQLLLGAADGQSGCRSRCRAGSRRRCQPD